MSHPNTKLFVLVSISLGALIGLFGYPGWEQTIETAQAQTGLVPYPIDNPFYQYHIRVFSLPILLADFLVGSLEEVTAGLVMSAFGGILAFLALSLFSYSFHKNAFFAWIVTGSVHLFGAFEARVPYHITLMGSMDCHGRTGLLFALLVVACLLLKKNRLGGFLLGLAPAMHLSLGLFLIGAIAGPVVLAATWSKLKHQPLPEPLQGIWAVRFWVVGGFAVFLTIWGSFTAYFFSQYAPTSAEDITLVRAFLEKLSSHHVQFVFSQDNLLPLVALFAVLGARFFTRRYQPWPSPFDYLFASLLLFGFLFVLGSHLPVNKMPLAFWQLIPPRLLNLCYLAVPLVVMSAAPLLGRFGWASVLLVQGGMLGWLGAQLTGKIALESFRFQATIYALLFLSLLHLLPGLRRFTKRQDLSTRVSSPQGILVFLLIGILFLYAAGIKENWEIACAGPNQSPDCWTEHFYPNYQNNEFFRAIHQEEGVLLAGGVRGIQLNTGKPVWLPNGINQGIYIPATMGSIDHRLKVAYGIDMAKYQGPRQGGIPQDVFRPVWEARSRDQWLAMGQEEGFSMVYIWTGWYLDLPLTATNGEFALYSVKADPKAFSLIRPQVTGPYGIERGFDHSTANNSFWEAANYPQEASIKFEAPQRLASFTLSAGEEASRMPTQFELLGSPDGTNWTQLQSWKTEAFKPNETRQFLVNSHPSFGYFRFRFLGGEQSIFRLYDLTPTIGEPTT